VCSELPRGPFACATPAPSNAEAGRSNGNARKSVRYR
jgi:hypothetical protein